MILTLDRSSITKRICLLAAGLCLSASSGHLAHAATLPPNNNVQISTKIFTGFFLGNWGVSDVDTAGETGYDPALVIDSNGNPNIAYNDWGSGDLRFAKWDGDKWLFETVDTDGKTGGTPSLTLDKQGQPHISYYNWDSGNLWYATKTNGSWQKTLVDGSGDVGIYSSIKVASDGRVHIAYEDITPNKMDLKYALKLPGSPWLIETVDTAGDVGQFASLSLGGQYEAPSIAYLDYTNHRLKYASRSGLPIGGNVIIWLKEVANATSWTGYYASLVKDAAGNPHIIHQQAMNQELVYTTKSGATWSSQIVDASSDVGEYASLAIDKDGNLHTAYYDATNLKLKYAKKNGATWNVQTITGTGAESWNTSIAIDSKGNPHVAYLDWLPGDLKYARWSTAPHLLWTGEPGFEADGVHPNVGNLYTAFNFKVSYYDSDGDPVKTGFPLLHIIDTATNQPASGSPFSMTLYGAQNEKTFFERKAWLPAGTYDYHFTAQDRWGVAAVGAPTVPSANGFYIDGSGISPGGENEVFAYPNPASTGLTFRMTLTQLAPTIEIKIFDATGAKIKTVHDGDISKGNAPLYEYKWDLTSDDGRALASGVYVYIVNSTDENTGDTYKVTKKLAILK
ncbi:MAG: FlgD immunoglobulin-like domain containing protein [Elusimicrobiota bacterium]